MNHMDEILKIFGEEQYSKPGRILPRHVPFAISFYINRQNSKTLPSIIVTCWKSTLTNSAFGLPAPKMMRIRTALPGCVEKRDKLWLILQHHKRRFAGDLHGKVSAAVPRVDLAHAGVIKVGDRRLDREDIPRMIDQRDRLGVRCAE